MTPERIATLEAVPGWVWEVDLEAQWQARLEELRQHAAQHGRLPVVESGPLGFWSIRSARTTRLGSAMTPEHRSPGGSGELGVVSTRITLAGDVPAGIAGGGAGWEAAKAERVTTGSWVASQCRAYRAFREGWAVRGLYKMTDARAEALEDLPGWRVL